MLDFKQNRTNRWQILSILLLFMAAVCLGQFAHGPLSPFIMQSLNLNKTQMGTLAMAVFGGGVFTTLLSGWLVDILGVKKMALVGGALMAAAFIGLFWAHTFTQTFWLLILVGIGFGTISPLTNKGVFLWFPSNERAFALGVKQSGSGIGTAIGAFLLPALALHYNWNTAYGFIGLTVIIATSITFYLYHDPTGAEKEELKRVNNGKHDGIGVSIWGNEMMICSACGLILGMAQGSFTTFLTPFLKENVNMPVVMAGSCLAVAQLGGTIGRPVWGLISDYIFQGNRKRAFYLLTLIAGLQGTILAFTAPGVSRIILIPNVFLLGATSMAWNALLFTLAIELTSQAKAGTASGMITTANFAGLGFGPPLFGYLVDIGGYRLAFLVFSLGLIIWGLFLAWWPLEKRLARRNSHYPPARAKKYPGGQLSR
ncbi:MAG: hypothetical protein PWP65_642 [Clostridia bacterium]|nr:hypothetical protein [Clostridia bacterium]